MPVPNTFATATAPIPLSQLDTNFATPITLGNTAIQLGNTVSTLNNMTLANVTVTSGNVTITNVTVTTANVTTANIATAQIANVTVSGTGTFAAGSNTAPSITTSGDTNTGIFFPAADTIAFTEGGVESMRIDSAGNVGIGTSLPGTKLDVVGVGRFSTRASSPAFYGTGTGITEFMDSLGTTGMYVTGAGASPSNSIRFFSVGNTLATLDSSGNLGLGVTPNTSWSTSRKVIQIGTNGALWGVSGPGAGSLFLSNNTYFDGTNFRYLNTSGAGYYAQATDGSHSWNIAASGTAGNAITFTQAMTLDANNVLYVNGTSQIAGSILNVRGNGSYIGVGGSTVQMLFGDNASTEGFLGTLTNHACTFRTNNTERMRLDSSGNLGLGVTPSAWDATSRALQFPLGGIESRVDSFSINQNAYFSSGSWRYYSTAAASLYNQASGSHVWYNAPSGTAGNTISFTQAMTLNASGILLVGTTSASASLAAGGLQVTDRICVGTGSVGTPSLHASGDTNTGLYFPGADIVGFATGGTERARITAAGGFTCAGIYNTTVGATNRDVFVDNTGVVGYVASIREAKTNIQDLTDTSWLHQLNPVTFHYRKKDEEGNYTNETDGDIQYGMIAEDVEQVRPDLCFYDEVDGEQELRGIQYSKLVPVMLKEIQKLKAEIEALKGNA